MVRSEYKKVLCHDDGDLSSAEVYDSKTNMWLPFPDMRKKLNGCAVTSEYGRIYTIGGEYGTRKLVSTEKFDQARNKLKKIQAMKGCRFNCAACGTRNKVHVVGGYNNNNVCLSSVEVYETQQQRNGSQSQI